MFDLSRSVDLHRHSMSRYAEKITGGITTGLMKVNDVVTWEARHLFKDRKLTVRITEMTAPDFFIDEQVTGDFLLMKHEHYFKEAENGTIMIDQFRFKSPYGMIGRLVNLLYLENYMTRLLSERNKMIKNAAESSQWKQYLQP